jgi:hypothetical protein
MELAPPAVVRVTRRRALRRDVGRFVSGVEEAKTSENERNCFAERNQGFRDEGRKSLRSLGARNQGFRRIVCFQWVDRHFVSRSRRMRSLDSKKP